MPATFTYEPDQLSTSELFQVRFAVGDTSVDDPDDRQLSDEEINFLIGQSGVVEAAAQAAERIAAKFARFADQRTGKVSTDFSKLQDHYLNLAKRIREGGIGDTSGAPEVFAGGFTETQRESEKSDDDRIDTAFDKGMHDNPLGPEGSPNDIRRRL